MIETWVVNSIIGLLFFSGPGTFLGGMAKWRGDTGKGSVGEAKVSQACRQAGVEVLDDFLLPDGKGGLTQIDHAVRLIDGIAVIETKDWDGVIVRADQQGAWTLRKGAETFRRPNPIQQNQSHIAAVRKACGNAPILSAVVMAGNAEFPEGCPDGVVFLSRIPRLVNQREVRWIPSKERDEIAIAWQRLRDAALTDRRSRWRHACQWGYLKEKIRHRIQAAAWMAAGIAMTAGLAAFLSA